MSTDEQNTQLQLDALTVAGCEQIYEEKESGSKNDRPELKHCLQALREGDILVVWKLDRLGRSTRHLIDIIVKLKEQGIGFQSLTQAFDTTTAHGALVFQIFAALAEYERSLIQERVKAGLAAAHKKGRFGGRPPALTEQQKAAAYSMYKGGSTKIAIIRQFKVSKPTIYKALAEMEERDRLKNEVQQQNFQ